MRPGDGERRRNGGAAPHPFAQEVFDLDAQYSPDGTQIAFTSLNRDGVHGGVYIMSSDGSDITRVTPVPLSAESPNWEPDGSKLVVETHCCGDPRSPAISQVNPNGTGLSQLTRPGLSNDFDPVFSPAGDAIVFEHDSADFSRFAVWVMAADGSDATRLARRGFQPAWGSAA